MSKTIVQLNASWTVTTNNGTAYSLVMTSAGALSAPGTFSAVGAVTSGAALNILIGGFKSILSHANTADRTYTFPDRGGTVALNDTTSLMAMIPTITGQNGKALGTSDGVNLSWISVGGSSLVSFNGISTATYNAQTLAIGTSGTAPAWTSINNNTNTHTLNIPMASTASVTAGLLSNADYANIPFKNVSNTFGGTQVFTNAPTITTPSTASNAVATYGQLTTSQAGLSVRPPVAAVDTASTTRPTANPVIDGYTVQLNDRVLFTALSSNNNQVYTATGSLGAVTWVLATDGQAGTGAPSKGDIVFVTNGTIHADQQYAYEGASWVLYNIASAYTFSTGLTNTSNTITVAYGSTGTTACVGNDSRLSDSRTPLAHQFDGALHTVSGQTAGNMLLATGATTFGFVTASGDWTINGSGVNTIAKIGGVAVGNLGLTINSATLADNTASPTLVTGAAFVGATYRNMRIDFSISRGSGNYAAGYINILFDGTNAQIQQVFDIEFGTTGITFTATNNAGTMQLMYTTTSTGQAATMRFSTQLFPV